MTSTNVPDIDVFGEEPGAKPGTSGYYTDSEPRIWARFLGKWVDFYLCQIPTFAVFYILSLLYGFGVGLFGWPYEDAYFEGWGFVIGYFVFQLLVFLLLEAFCISQFRNTPGKALMGIRVRSAIGGRLPFSTSLKRTGMSMLAGMGLCLPLISLLTHIMQARALSEDGFVLWDKYDGLQYQTGPVASWRWAIAILGYAFFRIVDAALSYL